MQTFRQYLLEGNPLARVKHHAEAGRHSVTISAQRGNLSKSENEKRHKELKKKIASQGYGYREAEGHWEGGKEKSLMVHAKGVGNKHGAQLHRDMKAHAEHYGQDSFLHHNGKTGVLHGTNDSGYPGKNKRALVGHKITANPPKSDFQTSLRTKKHAQATFAVEGDMKEITEQEYEARQEQYLNDHPVPTRCGFFGSWAWNAMKKHEFRDILRSEGYDIAPEPDLSDEALFGDDTPVDDNF